MIFSAVSRVSSFEADDDADESVSDGREKKQLSALLHHIDAGRSRMTEQRERSFSTAALSKHKYNGPVYYCSQLSYSYFGTCLFEEGKGEVWDAKGFDSSMRHVRRLV